MARKEYEPSVSMNKRLIIGILLSIFIVVGYVVWGLFKLTVIDHRDYAAMANETHFTNKTITAGRGSIYDANGEPLAWSATVYKVFMDPKTFREEMDDIEKIMEKREERVANGETLPTDERIITREELQAEIVEYLAEKLEISEDTVRTAMEKDTQYYVLKTQVEKTAADEIAAYFDNLGMVSITTEEDSKRYYPQNDLAAQVIGFTNSDGKGQYGLEAEYDDYLSGINGRVTTAVDGLGNLMPYRYSTTYEAQEGSSLYLTLDSTLQYYLEKNLQEMCEKNSVKNRACGILMNAKTGAIYAMGTYPSFDLNDPSEIYDEATRKALEALPEEEYQEAYVAAREEQWKNKTITEPYIPGSVFKIFTSSAAIEEHVIDPETFGYYCDGAYEIPGADPIKCHKISGHGQQTFSQALTNSCNPAFIEVGQKLGVEKFCNYFSAFGLTEKTNIDLPGEVSSIYIEEERMSRVDLASSSFGQANKLTAIEMITGIAAAVNGGYLVEPHVVSRIVSSDGNVLKTFDTNVKRQVISEETSAEMRKLLQAVVDNNGGSNAYIKGYAIGGKSGTSEKLDEYPKDNMQYVASYACFAPADDPEVVLLILADEPNTENNQYYGSIVCAPTASNIMADTLKYLGYYPEYTDEEYAQLDATVPLLIDADIEKAKSTIEALNLKYEVVGEGNTVVGQCPMTGATISANGTMILYTEENYVAETAEVPDLTGKTASEANALLTDLHLNFVASGASADREDVRVQSQSVEAGTTVPVGTVIKLNYINNSQGD